MDIGNIPSMYDDLYTKAANQSASKLQDKLSNADYSKATEDELMDACKQFEAYFIEQMYKGMQKTIMKSEESSGSTSTLVDYFGDQMIQSIAEQTTEQSSLGLAQMLYEQMRWNYGLNPVPGEEVRPVEVTGASQATETEEAETVE